MININSPPAQLLALIQRELKPKLFEKALYSEVLTPLPFIDDHLLADLPASVWSEPHYTWLDPAAGTGNFFVAVFYRLMAGLTAFCVDPVERQQHILTKMLFMVELNAANCATLRQRFAQDAALQLHHGDALLPLPASWPATFDVIVGNPPYNAPYNALAPYNNQALSNDKPLYPLFIEHFLDKSRFLSFLVPSKWFSTGGKGAGLVGFRQRFLQRTDLVYIRHFPDASVIFGSTTDDVSIEGGVHYFLKDAAAYSTVVQFNGVPTPLRAYDVLVDGRYHALIDKLCFGGEGKGKSQPLATFYKAQGTHGIETNDARLCKTKPAVTAMATYRTCYVSQKQGFRNYIDNQHLPVAEPSYQYQVFSPDGNGSAKCFGKNTFVAPPGTVHSKTYVAFQVGSKGQGPAVNSCRQAMALCAFLRSRLANVMLALRKNSQHLCASTCRWVPVPQAIIDDVAQDPDQWLNDTFVYDYFDLTAAERRLVDETSLKGYVVFIK